MCPMYWEDFTPGLKLKTLGRTVYDHDISAFVQLCGMYEELFMNREYYEKDTPYQGRIAPGALVYALSEGLVIQQGWLHRTGLAFLGLDNWRISRPTRPGDSIWVEVEVTDRKETKNPERGIVTAHHRVVNQKGEEIMGFNVTRMIRRKKTA
ncbi:MAG: MaoC family dehydratase N-terminal domain-containing protein [Chloroflexi bacterium]|nr:MaoC family dehydratase N-terminal domain-containing protein [Chloroflexota bacterium]